VIVARITAFVLLVLALAHPVSGEEPERFDKKQGSFLCLAELATGFKYQQGARAWRIARFHADRRYVVRPAKEGEECHLHPSVWIVNEVGNSEAGFCCRREMGEMGFLSCGAPWGEFRMNARNLRFLRYTHLGYYDVLDKKDEESDTPLMEIGECAPI
jgi:hypothetical protein